MKRMNLLPEEVRKTTIFEWLKKILLGSRIAQICILGSLLLVAITFIQTTTVERNNKQLSALKKEFNQTEKDLEESKKVYEFLVEKQKTEKEKEKILVRRLGILETALEERANWTAALSELSKVTPSNLWFKKISLRSDHLTLQGTASDNAIITSFMKSLDNSKVFKDTSFNYTRRGEKKASELINFEVTTSFKTR